MDNAVYEKNKNLFVETRKKINEFLYSRNSIDRLITDKINDFYLLDEQPLPVRVADKVIYIGNLTRDTYKEFLKGFAQIMAVIGCEIINIEMLNDTANLYKILLANDLLEKKICKLIKKTILNQQEYYFREVNYGNKIKIKLPKVSYRFFKKNITNEKLVEILFLIYLYNFDAVKKNFKILLERVGAAQMTETYMYSWLANLDSVTGSFGLSRLPNFDFWLDESSRLASKAEGN